MVCDHKMKILTLFNNPQVEVSNRHLSHTHTQKRGNSSHSDVFKERNYEWRSEIIYKCWIAK